MMDGHISCESEPGKGSTFSFTGRFGLKDKWERKPKPQAFQGTSVLIVDDNPTSLKILGSALISLGCEVKRAKSGDQAIGLIHALSGAKDVKFPDLVIADWGMPDPDGPKTVSQLMATYQKSGRTPPNALMMVQGPSSSDQQKTLDSIGAKGILTKPFTLKALHDAVVEVLYKGKPRPKKPSKASDYGELVAHLKGEHILLVEDNEVNQLVASRILKKAGFVVKIANNGLEAVDAVQKETFRLVLMDIQMPEMDGIEASQTIRKLPGMDALPIVAMTAHAMSGDKEMSFKAGMNDHINKPIDVQELFRTIAKWLEPGATGPGPQGGGPDGAPGAHPGASDAPSVTIASDATTVPSASVGPSAPSASDGPSDPPGPSGPGAEGGNGGAKEPVATKDPDAIKDPLASKTEPPEKPRGGVGLPDEGPPSSVIPPIPPIGTDRPAGPQAPGGPAPWGAKADEDPEGETPTPPAQETL
jgi:CheY-like chemotaxis protein